MKDLPIGIQTFEDIINNNYLYIDKTKYLYELIRPGKGIYFLSRPRRFGKSLTISTLECIFQGKKELFAGLFIKEQTNYDWQKYPVIRFDMSKVENYSKEVFVNDLKKKIALVAEQYNVEIDFSQHENACFQDLIRLLQKKYQKQVVILIDEYDKPIIDNLGHSQAITNRDVLRSFFGNLKSHDEYIKFIFVTGISKFTKVSMFSELNNLTDISMHERYASMLGYTKEELKIYFQEKIKELAKKKNIANETLMAEIKDWYNGYRFSEAEQYVYNPVSFMMLLDTGEFKNYWFQTGTSKMLVDFIKNQTEIMPNEFEALHSDVSNFEILDIEKPTLEPLMFQAGYLTIKAIERFDDTISYTLSYPNKEVSRSFISYLAKTLAHNDRISVKIIELVKLIYAGKTEEFLTELKTIFANLTYGLLPIEKDREKYYSSLLYLIFKLLGLTAGAEESTNKGRIDTVVETDTNIYLIEYKIDKSAQVAIDQIKAKEYFQKYQDRKKKIILIGINFSTEKRNIDDWKIEKQN